MENHPIENLMKCTMENIKDMIDVNTIVGEPVVTCEGTTIVPISKVSFGFASGGSEFLTKHNACNSLNATNANNNVKIPFGGGSGAGVTVKPVGFLVINKDSIRMLSVDSDNTYDKIVDSVPQIIDMIGSMINNNSKEKEQ